MSITNEDLKEDIAKEKENIQERLHKVLKSINANNTNINYERIKKLPSFKLFEKLINKPKKNTLRTLLSYWDVIILGLMNFIFLMYLCYFVASYYNKVPKIDFATEYAKFEDKAIKLIAENYMKYDGLKDLTEVDCAIPIPDLLYPAVRPIDDCSMCLNVKEIKRVQNISKEEFLNKYAYSGVPVIITDASQNWTAMSEINFKFLKDLYHKVEDMAYRKRQAKIDIHENKSKSPILTTFNSIVETDEQREEVEKDTCQFFPYKTNFTGLEDLFDMEEDDERWKKPWYVGWSNCNSYAADILRQHYSRPYFLPDDSEISRIDSLLVSIHFSQKN